MAEHWSLAYKINVLDNKKGNLEMVWYGIFTDAGFIAVYSACYSNLQFSLCPVPDKVWEHFVLFFFALSPICTGGMQYQKRCMVNEGQENTYSATCMNNCWPKPPWKMADHINLYAC